MVESLFTIGCDAEFFLRQRKSGKLVSAIPFIKGTKENPEPLPKGGNLQRDNVAVEFATDPAVSCKDFLRCVKNTLTEAVKKLPKDTEIVALPSAHLDPDQLKHPEAERFGCDPDYDAWTVEENDKPYTQDLTFRSCGAHIHVGTTGEDENAFLLDFQGKIDTIKGMDCIHGIISTVLDSSQEARARRKLYGKPGAHRPKMEYGVEYRVLSNYWLKSPVTVMMMYHLTQDVLRLVRENEINKLIEELDERDVINTIINGDVETAMKMIDKSILHRLSDDSRFYFNEALSKLKANDMDFHKEWKIYT